MNFDQRIQHRLDELTGPEELPGDTSERIAWPGKVLTLVKVIAGQSSDQYKSLQNIYDNYLKYGGRSEGAIGGAMVFQSFKGAIISLKSDYEAGLLVDLRSEIRAEVQGDFLDQTRYLLDQGKPTSFFPVNDHAGFGAELAGFLEAHASEK